MNNCNYFGTGWIELRMCQGVWAIFSHKWLITLLFRNRKANCLCNWQSTASWPAAGVLHKQFSKCKLEYLCLLRPFNTAKNCCPTTCIRATVTPNRSLFGKPPGTSLKSLSYHALNHLEILVHTKAWKCNFPMIGRIEKYIGSVDL